MVVKETLHQNFSGPFAQTSLVCPTFPPVTAMTLIVISLGACCLFCCYLVFLIKKKTQTPTHTQNPQISWAWESLSLRQMLVVCHGGDIQVLYHNNQFMCFTFSSNRGFLNSDIISFFQSGTLPNREVGPFFCISQLYCAFFFSSGNQMNLLGPFISLLLVCLFRNINLKFLFVYPAKWMF